MRRSFGGGQSESSRHFTSVVDSGIDSASDLKGSAQVDANALMSRTRSSLVAGARMGSGEEKNPGRRGQDMASWVEYFFFPEEV